MKYWIMWFLVSILVSSNSNAVCTESGRPACIVVHDTNNVEILVSNFGSFGRAANGGPGCFWPKGSGHSYIFGAGIWFGTIDFLTGDTLVTIGYGPHGGETEFVPGLENLPPTHPDAIIYVYPDNWPAPITSFPMAPTLNVSHQDSWCAFNDCDSTVHMPGDGRPIGIEVYQTVYVWDLPNLEDIVFFDYEIKNVTEHKINSCYIGTYLDRGISFDYSKVILNDWYVINSESIHVDNFVYQYHDIYTSWDSCVVGFDLLQTDFDLSPGMDKDNDGIPDQYERDSSYYVNNLSQSMWDVDRDHVPDWRDASENPQIGLTAMKLFTLNLDPNKDNERYMTLAGYNFKTGEYCPFDTMPPEPDDMRCLLASGPFSIKPDSSIMLVFAIMFANWRGIYQKPDTAIVLVDKWAQLYYDMNYYRYTSVGEGRSEERTENNFMVLPNPVTTQGHIIFSVPTSEHIKIKLYNVLGQAVKMVAHGYFAAGKHDVAFSVDYLSSGTYFIMLETGNNRRCQSVIIK
ncbi:hypothetical protein A2Y85_03240 [candidate division WOR-3 bacterium RBG_13_43_14]|uniref:Secretion system C-terminal sorting domain-containing protein n=1 Tax=candidate division WOR-3 bacterium RBG_13_43_14 TaxID=1802590 RepID=A0A1F4U275_UNCW3|nr:MAG: hypothetical protein A2Y85_03240 [candidate division WOR-3 bacterium RBG_13_43_14]